jgi:hypothetical protein
MSIMKKMLVVLFCTSAVVGLTLFVAGTLLFTDGVCPERLAGGGAPWFKPYHFGENPWIGAWTLPGTSLPAPKVATADTRHHRAADHVQSMGACERAEPDAKAKLAS